LRRLRNRRKGRFCGHPGRFCHHINGVFADDMMDPASVPEVWRGFAEKRTKFNSRAGRLQDRYHPIGFKGMLSRSTRCLPDIFA
jgi:hypothetical protein